MSEQGNGNPQEPQPTAPQQRRGYRHRQDCSCRLCQNIQRGQPKTTARHSASQLRRKRFVAAFSNPDSKTFANGQGSAIQAGFAASGAPNAASRLLQEEGVRSGIIAAQERLGVDSAFLSKRLREALLATETKFFAHQGEIINERVVKDNYTRLKSLELAHRLRGDLTQDQPMAQAALLVNLGDEALPEGDWEKRVAEINASQKLCPHCKTDHPPTYDCQE